MTDGRWQVCVEVCTAWTAPDAPRDLDAAAVGDRPDVPAWLATLDRSGPDGRLGLHGRTLTQLLAGEPVLLLAEAGDWVQVAAPWQPCGSDPRGYPGWVRRSHVARSAGDSEPESTPSPAAEIAADRAAVLDRARRYLGLAYLWGGTSPYALDCSGLVHVAFRAAGVVVPRDAHDQTAAATPVALGEERPGDLYFFARADGYVHHVGFVSAAGRMLHAPETGRYVEEVDLPEERRATLVAAGRFLD